MLKTIGVKIARLMYQSLCWFVPTRPNRISFISYPDYSDNAKAVSDYLLETDEWELVWLTSNAEPLQNLHPKLKQVKKNSLVGLIQFLTSSVVFYTHGTYFFAAKGGPLQINLWHGMPIKNIGILDNKAPTELYYCDYSIATSFYFQTKIARSFGLNADQVWPIGLPRNDYLLQHDEHVRSILDRQLDIDRSIDLIFWLPTFRKSRHGDVRTDSQYVTFLDEWPSNFLPDLDRIARASKTCVIIKLHPMDSLNGETFTQEFRNVKVIPASVWSSLGVDLYAALGQSAALISDVSSVLIDYLITGKPIGITGASIAAYQRGLMDNVTTLTSSLPLLNSEVDFFAFIESAASFNRSGAKLAVFYDENLRDAESTKRLTERVFQQLGERNR